MFQKVAKLGHPGGELGGTQSWVVGGGAAWWECLTNLGVGVARDLRALTGWKGTKKKGASLDHMRGATIHQPRMWIARLSGGFGHKVEGCNEGLCALSGPRPQKRCLCSLLPLLKWFGVECFMSRVRVFRWIWWQSQWEGHNVPVLSKLGWANEHMHTNECGSYVLFPPCFILISKIWMNLVLLRFCAEPQDAVCRTRLQNPDP